MLGYKWKSTCHGLKQAKTRDEQHVECVVVKHSTVKQYSTRASGVGKGYSHGCCCLRHSASGLVATAEHHPWEYPLPTPLARVLYCLIMIHSLKLTIQSKLHTFLLGTFLFFFLSSLFVLPHGWLLPLHISF